MPEQLREEFEALILERFGADGIRLDVDTINGKEQYRSISAHIAWEFFKHLRSKESQQEKEQIKAGDWVKWRGDVEMIGDDLDICKKYQVEEFKGSLCVIPHVFRIEDGAFVKCEPQE